jgi:hypothetical protein
MRELLPFLDGYSANFETGEVFGKQCQRIGTPNRDGYLRTTLTANGVCMTAANHRIVWTLANGEIPDGLYINHIDGNKANNRLANLELVTAQENTVHAFQTGLRSNPAGQQHPRSKLTDSDVETILSTPLEVRSRVLAERFGVNGRTIRSIRQRRSWKHINAKDSA